MARKPEAQPTMKPKRLTIEIPADLHQRIKVDSAIKGQNMADALRAMMLERWPPTPSGRTAKERATARG